MATCLFKKCFFIEFLDFFLKERKVSFFLFHSSSSLSLFMLSPR